MWSTNKVYEPLHMHWICTWTHQQPVTTALVDSGFDSWLKAWVTVLGYKPYQYVVVESPYPSKAACTNKVYEPLQMQWMGTWNHWQPVITALVDPGFDSRLKALVTLLGYKPYAACTSMWSS